VPGLDRILPELDGLHVPYSIDLSAHGRVRHAGLPDHVERVGDEFYRREPGA
jgi:hypothetical protein